jgi:hypothetical protein
MFVWHLLHLGTASVLMSVLDAAAQRGDDGLTGFSGLFYREELGQKRK